MTPILATKLYLPPLRPNVVSRPRLIERLNEGLHHKLTLISAPSGFGKTTLVSEWIAGYERPVAWLSLDEGDNDPTLFLTYLVAALQTIAPNIGEGVLGVLRSPLPPPNETILTTLLNDITTISDHLGPRSLSDVVEHPGGCGEGGPVLPDPGEARQENRARLFGHDDCRGGLSEPRSARSSDDRSLGPAHRGGLGQRPRVTPGSVEHHGLSDWRGRARIRGPLPVCAAVPDPADPPMAGDFGLDRLHVSHGGTNR